MWILIVTILIIIVLLSLYVYKESTGYHIVRYSIDDARVKKDKTTIVFMSDLHNKQHGQRNADVLADIENINPDYVFIGGDMITSCMEHWSGYDDTLAFIDALSKKYKVVYGMGNHEERLRRKPNKFPEGAYDDLTDRLSKMGCPILSNECEELDFNIRVYGLDLDHKYYRKVVTRKIPDGYLEEKLGAPDKNLFNVLLAHNPEHFKSYAEWGSNLVLSGHVHGGIVRLPYLGGVVSPALKLFPKYDGGEFIEYGSRMILSRGLGTHTIPVRINNKAELIVIDIMGSQD